jgi:hypothetical protein
LVCPRWWSQCSVFIRCWSNERVDPQPTDVKVIVTKYTPEDLKKLPLRAIVSLKARCARRVERLRRLPDDHLEQERRRSEVASTIGVAENLAKGLPCSSHESVIREAEACRPVVEDEFIRIIAMVSVAHAACAAATALRALNLRGHPAERHRFSSAPGASPFPHLADVPADQAARDAVTAALEAAAAIGHTDHFMKGVIPSDPLEQTPPTLLLAWPCICPTRHRLLGGIVLRRASVTTPYVCRTDVSCTPVSSNRMAGLGRAARLRKSSASCLLSSVGLY